MTAHPLLYSLNPNKTRIQTSSRINQTIRTKDTLLQVSLLSFHKLFGTYILLTNFQQDLEKKGMSMTGQKFSQQNQSLHIVIGEGN